MPLEFNKTERYVLEWQGGYSRQLVDYWEKQGSVPSKHLLRVRDLIGRRVEELLGGEAEIRPLKEKNGAGSAA